jgi:hypothetical protein
MANKPVVVLAGWLGCQPRNLRRYHDKYDELGWTTVIRIGSPQSVLNAMTMGPSSSSSSDQHTIKQSSSEMLSSLAISLLTEISSLQPPYFVIHIFSNNGCFLWEWIRYLLFDEKDEEQSPSLLSSLDMTTVNNIYNLSRKLIGVLLQIASTIDIHLLKHRFDEFWNGLCNDTTNIPQLYMYSSSDELASAKEIDRLIQYRTNLKQGRNSNDIWKYNFTDSEHCGHILKYPEVYYGKVKQFLDFCTTNRTCCIVSQQSRL